MLIKIHYRDKLSIFYGFIFKGQAEIESQDIDLSLTEQSRM